MENLQSVLSPLVDYAVKCVFLHYYHAGCKMFTFSDFFVAFISSSGFCAVSVYVPNKMAAPKYYIFNLLTVNVLR